MASTIWRGYITFGLISIPVRLFRAARAERVSFRRLYRQEPAESNRALESEEAGPPKRFPAPASGRRAESLAEVKHPTPVLSKAASSERTVEPILMPVKQASVSKESNEVLPTQFIVKGFEYEKNRFVVVEPEELKSAAQKTSTEMEIQEFVKLSEIDPVYFETSYYVSPEEAGEKAYALLYGALQVTGLVAIAQFAMHNREHVVVLRPGNTGLLAHTMFFASEVRADEEFRANTGSVSGKELELAQTLIQSMAAPFEPQKYRDTYRERLESIIAAKVQGQPVRAKEPVHRQAEVVDIADALRRSLANLKKPVASDQQARKPDEVPSHRAKKASRGSGQ